MHKITLDKRTIRALASETRVDILKTVHKHLTILIESGLVKKVNKDNKWAHYELTDKGTEILHPRKMTRIIVLLSAAILSFAVGIAGLYWVCKKYIHLSRRSFKFKGYSSLRAGASNYWFDRDFTWNYPFIVRKKTNEKIVSYMM